MNSADKIDRMLMYHKLMVGKLEKIDLNKLSRKQLDKLDEAFERLEGYWLTHVKLK